MWNEPDQDIYSTVFGAFVVFFCDENVYFSKNDSVILKINMRYEEEQYHFLK